MPIALFVAGIDAGDFDGDFDARIRWGRFVDGDGAAELLELTTHGRNHHVANGKRNF